MIRWKIMTSGGFPEMENPMIKQLFFLSFLIVIALFRPDDVLSRQLVIDSEEQFAFAVKYMDRGEYRRAIAEFERLIYFFPEDEKLPQARLLIGKCYIRAKEYEAARNALEKVYKQYAPDKTAGRALFLIGESYYLQGVAEEAKYYFYRVLKEFENDDLRDMALFRLGCSLMKTEKWSEAAKTFNMVRKSNPLHVLSLHLSEKSLQGDQLPRKNPTTAGIMAGIIPGLGHAYCGRYKDGIVSLLLNGLFIWAAIESFDQDNEVLGGILTFLEVGWYSGNIYSAVNTAHKYNRRVKQDFLRDLPKNLDFNLFTLRNHQIGLALKIDF